MNKDIFKKASFTRILFLLVMFVSVFSVSFEAGAQTSLQARDLSTVRSDDVSNSELMRFVERGREEGMNVPEMFQMARQRGLPASEADKLIRRVRQIEEERRRQEMVETERVEREDPEDPEDPEAPDPERVVRMEDELRERIFGARLFRQEGLTFEPSMHVPTPRNYELGPGDEIVVDIWGEATNVYRLEVSNEGTVKIEHLAPIYVHGLTIDEAEERIIDKLKILYRGLRGSGTAQSTFARVNLGELRSIQVTIMGEVRVPGNYTLSSLATVFNALYNSRGPNNIGSFRNVKIIRRNETVATLDIYDLLIHGEQIDNIRLHDQDIIKVDPYDTRVDIQGAVKREGLFEMQENETLDDLIRFAGNFSDSAYTAHVRIHRNTPTERRIVTVKKEEFSSFNLHTGDAVFVDHIIDRFENRVEISGAVWRPGEFELKEGMTVYNLIESAEGLRPDAFGSRAIIYRLKDNFDFELVSFDLNRLMEDPQRYDIQLKAEDEVIIQNIFDMRDEYTVRIGGEVRNDSVYSFRENMTLEDLILKAGGFRESASEAKIEVFRRIEGEVLPETRSTRIAEIFTFDVNRNLALREEDKQFKLKPFDQVFIRRKPDYQVQHNVEIEGEVMYPGTYALVDRNERISDLIKRAGGITAEAYTKGATLKREEEWQAREEVELVFGFDEIIERDERRENYVGINLAKIISEPGSDEDLLLREGDVIRIPQEMQTVKVSGAVLRDVEVKHQDGRGVRYYINRAGGYSEDAFRRRAYVIYANGSIEARRNFLFFKMDPDIEPGAEIIIPEKADREPMDTREFISIMSSIASTAAIIVSLLR